MRGTGSDSRGTHFVFPIVAGLLIVIALLVFLSNRNAKKDQSLVVGSASASTAKTSNMTIADKVIVPLTLMTMPLRGGEKAIGDIRKRSEVYAENERLREEIAKLSDAEMRANALAMKIRRFESLLSADVGIDIPVQKIAGRIVSENDGPFARSALLNVGAKSGVRVGHAVMTEDGLYGHIVAVGKRSSRVLLLQDINSRIAVMSPRSEARAIMVGTNGPEPSLQFVARDADWSDGDAVVTSGDEGVLPRGLPVGEVKQRSAEKRNVVLDVTGKSVDWVWVFPYVPVLPPEQDPASEADFENAIAPMDTAQSVQPSNVTPENAAISAEPIEAQ